MPDSRPGTVQPRRALRYSVLFVCTGNICRSAYAECRSRRLDIPELEFNSAGTHALVGHSMEHHMVELLPEPGVAAGFAARQITRELGSSMDLLLVMEGEQRQWIIDEFPELVRRTFLLGHAARELRGFPEDGPLEQVAEHLWRRRTRADDDIPDPYRRGWAAAQESAAMIDAGLNVVLQVLRSAAQRRRDE